MCNIKSITYVHVARLQTLLDAPGLSRSPLYVRALYHNQSCGLLLLPLLQGLQKPEYELGRGRHTVVIRPVCHLDLADSLVLPAQLKMVTRDVWVL